MKVFILYFILSTIIYFDDSDELKYVCYNSSLIAYKMAIDIYDDMLIFNKKIFEESFEDIVEMNLNTYYLYRHLEYGYSYKNGVVINVYYHKLLFHTFSFSLIGDI